MEAKFKELEADFKRLAEAYDYSCAIDRLMLRLIKAEADIMSDYEVRLKAAKGIDDKFDVFLSLFPPESRVLVGEAFRRAADMSIPPSALEDLRPWRYDYGTTWQVTYAVGRVVALFTCEHGKLKVNGLEFDMPRERSRSIAGILTSFHNVFID
jgi:hypothetical protein